MITVGDKLPAFRLTAVIAESNFIKGDGAFITVMDHHLGGPEKLLWTVLVAWPRDFTFVCPTEILGYHALSVEFAKRNTVIYGLSTNHRHDHLRWRRDDLPIVQFPWLADETQGFSSSLGILRDGVCLRATFIIDPNRIIRHVTVNDDKVGRSPNETLRVLDALQTEELTPCGWAKGDPTL